MKPHNDGRKPALVVVGGGRRGQGPSLVAGAHAARLSPRRATIGCESVCMFGPLGIALALLGAWGQEKFNIGFLLTSVPQAIVLSGVILFAQSEGVRGSFRRLGLTSPPRQHDRDGPELATAKYRGRLTGESAVAPSGLSTAAADEFRLLRAVAVPPCSLSVLLLGVAGES